MGVQCPKALWFYRNRRDLKAETDDAQQALFDQGNEIGQLAQTYFKGGVEVENEYWDINGAIKKTHLFAILALTSKRVEVIIVKEYI